MLGPEAGQGGGEQPGRHRRVADQDAVGQEVVDVERLVGADPRVDALVEDADALGVRDACGDPRPMARARSPAAAEDAGRVARARREHDQRRADLEPAARPAVVVEQPAAHADRARAAARARDRPARR